MSKCGTCGLELPAGAVHVSPDGCVDALREALDRALECRECGSPVSTPLHSACMVKAAARKGSSVAIDRAAKYFWKEGS